MERGSTPSTPADRAPRLPRTRSHATMRKAGSATRLNRSSNRRPGSSVAHWCSLVWIPSTRASASIEARPRRVGVHRRPPGIPAPLAANSLGPFAMCPAFPCSDYYGPSAPSRRHQPTVGLPAAALAAAGEGNTGTVPTFTMYRSTRDRRPALPLQPRHGYAAGLHRGLPTDDRNRLRSRPPDSRSRALLPGPHPPGWSRLHA